METTPTPAPKTSKTTYIILIAIPVLVVLGGLFFLWKFGGLPRINVDPAHQRCVADDDCVMVSTMCSCDCGTPVHKDYEEYYDDKIQEKCENYSGLMCSITCNYAVTCDSGVCTKHEVIPAEHDITMIQLVIKAPFSTETIRMDTTGKVYYFAENNIDNTKRQDQKRIETQAYIELADFIAQSNFFSLNEYYIEQDLQDATAYTVKVTKNGEDTSVSCYGQCPDDTVQIREQIIELWGEDILNIGV